MESNAGLVAGSHNRNESVRIRHEGEAGPKPVNNMHGPVCQICGDTALSAMGEVFVACNECAFPVCRPCYEYERKDGTQACPQCETRYKRHKGSPRVDGDEEEDDADDLDNEFYYVQGVGKPARQWKLPGKGEDIDLSSSRDAIPRLTSALPSTRSQSGPSGPGERRHSHSYLDPSTPVDFKNLKDLELIWTFDWKEKVEGWKLKHGKNMMQMTKQIGDSLEGTGSNGENMQMVDDARLPMTRIVPIPSNQLNLYRVVIILRLIILGFFFQYRTTHPVPYAYPLWLTSVICEILFALSWLLDQFPKWYPMNHETYLDRLVLRFDREGEPSQLAPIDIFVSTVDPLKEPLL